ncbi:MAG: acyltransferase [Chlamydiota bacterium]|nr:acyltransferase [Chlamydiota bacterium]
MGANCSFRSFRLRQYFTVYKNAELEIGEGSFFNDGVNLGAAQSIKIGHHTKIGDMTYIYDTDFHQLSPEASTKCSPVIIGNNVWIGANSMILPGSVIGDHSVIAAGSIVTGEIPPKSLAAGIPAKLIKTLNIPDDWLRK